MPIFNLIDVYTKLSSPFYVEIWEELLETANKIKHVPKSTPHINKTSTRLSNNLEFKEKLLDYISTESQGYILLNSSKEIANDPVIEIISVNDITHDYRNIETLAYSIFNIKPIYKQQSLHLPTNPANIKRFSFYIKINNVEIPILTIYKANMLFGFYEIEYNSLNLRVPTSALQLLFMHITEWVGHLKYTTMNITGDKPQIDLSYKIPIENYLGILDN